VLAAAPPCGFSWGIVSLGVVFVVVVVVELSGVKEGDKEKRLLHVSQAAFLHMLADLWIWRLRKQSDAKYGFRGQKEGLRRGRYILGRALMTQ
jgi:hypothetical protein